MSSSCMFNGFVSQFFVVIIVGFGMFAPLEWRISSRLVCALYLTTINLVLMAPSSPFGSCTMYNLRQWRHLFKLWAHLCLVELHPSRPSPWLALWLPLHQSLASGIPQPRPYTICSCSRHFTSMVRSKQTNCKTTVGPRHTHMPHALCETEKAQTYYVGLVHPETQN